jgi:hypothetical protein
VSTLLEYMNPNTDCCDHRNETRSLAPFLTSLSAQQDLINHHVIVMKDDLSVLAHDTRSFSPSLSLEYAKSATKKTMQASVMRGILDLPGVMIQYCQSAGQRKTYSLLLGFKMLGSKVVLAQVSGNWCKIAIPRLWVKVKNIVTEDSEIFKACKAGNVVAVRDLLWYRKASLSDITPRNETLLTVSDLPRIATDVCSYSCRQRVIREKLSW